MTPAFLYIQSLEKSDVLVYGRLLMFDLKSYRICDNYIATSGLAKYQQIEYLSQPQKGCIPPNDLIGIDYYSVVTKPLNRKNVKGIEGNFYQIFPEEVRLSGNVRGDFGIHFDANVPGSAGCIVIKNEEAWKILDSQLQIFNNNGILELPLIVQYIRKSI